MEITKLGIGDSVPDFTIETFDPLENDFSEISLDSLKKKKKWTVLFFYPADFTFVCPTELADLAGVHKELSDLGVEVISMSTDTKFTHLGWKQAEMLLKHVKYQMGADPTGKISRMFGVYDEASGLALRGTFIISPEGKLVGSEINYYNCGRNADELLRKIKANVYLAKHPNEACPAKWEVGDKTLKPGAKLVGKVYEALKK
ncbi:MAG: redoxin domain-containing protein [Ignavibacteriales bacterium]|nr:redoxin domain-containing protein [Ignavibacteriales bacterium]